MKFEGYTAKQEIETALDQELFDKLQEYKVSAIADVSIEIHDEAAQKEKFLSGEIRCPHFTYEKIRSKDYDAIENGLLDLKRAINRTDATHEAVGRSYVWVINERIARTRMLKEIQKLEQGGDPAYHMRRFMRYAYFIYGTPQQEIYEGMTHILRNELEQASVDVKREAPEAYERLMALVATAPEPTASIAPQEEKEDVEDIQSIEDVKTYFEDAIVHMGLDADWKVEVDTEGSRSNLSVSLARKKVFLPSQAWLDSRPSARSMTIERIRGLIVHELGTHALRNHNGLRSRLRLLSTGLDRYEVGEEGLATYREQQEERSDAADYARFDYYFAACLASGLDGGGPRDFAGVYGILEAYYRVCKNMTKEQAQEAAWKRCVRTFRGTPGDVPGAYFPKDAIYRKGNIATYSLMEREGSEKIDFNVGKFDPSNPRHLSILIELGILDSDLEQLAKDLA